MGPHLSTMIFEIPALLFLIFVTSYGLTKLLYSAPDILSLFDHPNERSLHSTPTPRTGGIGILGGLFLGGLIYALIHSLYDWYWILGLTGLMSILSFCDDRQHLPPVLRLTFQFLLAILFITLTQNTLNSLGFLHFGWLRYPLTLLFLVWMTNLYNFMDGMDGFAGGMTVFGCGFFSLMAWSHGDTSTALLSLFTMTASAGFLPHNFPPAKIFMGDVGSTSLGFLIGCMIVTETSKNTQSNLWEPLLIFSPFLVDATFTLLKRIAKRKKIWLAHREHLYQRLVLLGWGHKKTVFLEYGLMLACGLSALFYLKLETSQRLILLLLWATVYGLIPPIVLILERKNRRRNSS